MRTETDMDLALTELKSIISNASEQSNRNRAARILEIVSSVFTEVKLRRDGIIRKKHNENVISPRESGEDVSN